MTTKKLTKLLALYLPYILLGLVATNFGEAWRLAEGKELGDKIMSMMGTIPVAFANPLPSLHPLDILVGLCCGAGLRLAVYLCGKNAKKYRHGMEYGSARWGTPKDIEPFMSPKFSDNIILTKTERLMMSNRPPDPKNARNKNVLVVGGSGSGKTRFWLKPNLLQCHSSYVVTDPKGTIVLECGQAMLKNGYKVKVLNTINFKKSMHYNPFAYVHSEKDILKLVTTLMTNTKGEGSGGDPFWEKSERLLLTALIAYLHYEAPVEEQNFATLLEMLNTMQVLEDDEEYQNPVDLLFEELAKKKPNSFAGRQYKLYKLAAGKTAKSILISCGARLAPFDIQELRDLTMYDELQLDTLGDKKTALFLIMSDTDSTFNFLISMVYTQLFNLLCDKADIAKGGQLLIQNWKFQRGDIFFTRFDNAIGSEQSGNRPAVVLQNDVGNFYSPTLIVATLTSKAAKKYTQPTHCLLVNEFLSVPSIVQAEQIFTVDKSRVLKFLGHLTPEEMSRVDDAVRASLALNPMGNIQRLPPIIRSQAAYAPPEVVDGKPPLYS